MLPEITALLKHFMLQKSSTAKSTVIFLQCSQEVINSETLVSTENIFMNH